jgi:LPS-assembly lipoprotein
MKLPAQYFPKSLMLLLALSLAACGFHLRGEAKMPFNSIFIEAANPNSLLVGELRRLMLANKIQLTSKADQADLVLNLSQEFPEKQILTLGGSGRVSEFQLRYRVSLRAYDQQQRDWLAADELQLSRDFSYDDTQILAKEAEEAQLYQYMRSDMAQQIMRRLSHAQPQPLTQK